MFLTNEPYCKVLPIILMVTLYNNDSSVNIS